MKRFLTPAATFNPTAGTLDLSAIPSFDIRRLAAVFDLKTQAMIYGPVAGFGSTAVVNGVVTLQASLTGLAGSDSLLVIYDDATGKVAEDASVQSVLAAINTLITDVANNHADLGQLHTDLTGTLHADLVALATKLGSSPAQSSDVAAVVTRLGSSPAQSSDVAAVAAKLGTAPAQSADIAAIGTKLGTPAQTGDVAAVVSRLGAAPAQTADLTALGVILQSILTTLQSTRIEQTLTDDSGAFYVRVEAPGSTTPTFYTLAGAPSAAPGAGVRPAAGTSVTTTTDTFKMLNAGTGYVVNDLCKHIVNTDPSSGAIIGQFWLNATQGTKLSASPLAADLQLLDPQAEGAATLAAQLAGNAILSALQTALATLHTDSQTNHADLVTLHTDSGTTLHGDLQALASVLGTTGDAATLQTLNGLTKKLVALLSAALTVNIGTTGGLALDSSVAALGTLIGAISSPAAGTVLAVLAGLKGDLDTGLTNDTTALSAVTAATTARGTYAPASYPESLDTNASGDSGVRQRIWANLFALLAATKAVQPRSIASNAARVVAPGTLTAVGDAVVVACDGMNTVVAQLAAATAGAAIFEASADGQVTWTPVNMVPYGGGTPTGTPSFAAAAQLFEMACGGLTHVRTRCTAAFSGATAVVMAATNGHKSLRVGAPAANPVPVLPGAYGIGNSLVLGTSAGTDTLVVAKATANGVALPVPAGARSMLIELTSGAYLQYAMKVAANPSAPAALASPPAAQVKRTNAYPAGVVLDFEMPLGGGRVMYVTDWAAGSDGTPPTITFL